ncbi:hypothetical protein LOK49_LG09G00893 [Camellia lanceoleosa]|uniref:Uncharacterized protein n=1 Tax=Camellia lanceoleosa TaxID=1840588 RepID=A0ACC0GL53_9ERIC|nr:hypothetical protein LOK49_LG09G00893 [Camellia lanceoleosa]
MEALELPEATDECEDVSPRCLVGKILAPKTLNKPAVSKILLAAWKARAGVVITPWKENVFLFQFEDLADRLRVLQEAPWSVMGSLIVLQPLPLGKAIDELEFRWSPFWVQVHGLPIDKMTRAHGEVIGNRIGRLMEIEAPSDGLLLHRSFLRLRVEVDVSKPLLQGFILYRRDSLGPVGDGLKVFYKYERLSDFCYDCGRIGHDKLACKFVSREEGLHSGYGPNQRTGPAKSLSVIPSSVTRTTEELRPGKDMPESPPLTPISGMGARRQGVGRDEASGTAILTPHQLADNVGVRSVRARGVDLGAAEPSRLEATRPCSHIVAQPISSDRGPPLHASGLVSGSTHLCESSLGPTVCEGEAQSSLSPSEGKAELAPLTPYFVTEPADILPLISKPMGSTEPPSISVHELSPSPSPERTGTSDPSLELCISNVFNTLSLKRPLGGEDACNLVAMKKFKGAVMELTDAGVASQALSISAPKPKARVMVRRGRRQRPNPLVDIPVQSLPTEPTLNPGATVPISVISWGDDGSSMQVGRIPSAESLGNSEWGKSVLCSMVWVAWTIWKGRNEHLFNQCLVDPEGVIVKATRDEAEFLASCPVPTSTQRATTGVASRESSWVPPPRGHWKLNCDAAVDLKLGKGTVAVLLRDHSGNLVDGQV